MYSVVGALIILLTASEACFGAFSGSPAYRKQQARTQYETAERMREALNGRPAEERTRKAYQKVADAYRKVYYVSPASSKADASVVAVAEILAEMGRQFWPDEKDLHAAIAQYEFLRREYPGSKYRVEALFTIAQIYKEDLGDESAAKATFEEFLKRYPRNQLAPKAQEALAELNQPKAKKKPEIAARGTASQPTDTEVGPVNATAAPRVTGIRYWSTADYTRVAIDLDGEVKYESGRVPDPDRIFFDLPDTRLVSTLVGKSFDVQDGFLKKIRVAQYQKGSTRVVLEVDDVTEYSAFLLPNPYRLIIDIHGTEAHTAKVQDNLPPMTASESGQNVANATLSEQSSGLKSASKASSTASTPPDAEATARPEQKAAAKTRVAKTVPASKNNARADDDTSTTTNAFKNSRGELTAANTAPPEPAPWTVRGARPADDAEAVAESPVKPTTKPTTAPTAVTVVPEKKKGKKGATVAASDTPAAHEAMPTSAGDRSLIRALGLKIGRIVIDAGHGGHDTGTIGPNGLQEKDLVLDVALRLGRLLETKLGAEVIYTRDDDTFIPLETRTAIANEHQADLFISVHANSSQDESARGVETYYLNFTSNPDALEVAARENAVSQKSIYELQDLVKKITLKDKIDESRELANDVQQSLYAGLSPKNPTLRNRGVKKAPFVVLIGANMPSILAEISFVSNPTDEKKLETPDYRQKIAESLFKGIAKYIGGLSGIKVASKQLPVASSQ
jgi:N-acetylmuramoyl-L-alanine amidase